MEKSDDLEEFSMLISDSTVQIYCGIRGKTWEVSKGLQSGALGIAAALRGSFGYGTRAFTSLILIIADIATQTTALAGASS